MIIKSDWHIHSEASYDATLPLDGIAAGAERFGFEKVGITDHANFNDEAFLGDLKRSVESVKKFQQDHPNFVLGVELTPIEKPEFDYIAKHGTREGYVAPIIDSPFEIELARTKEELMAMGVRYAIGASHWRVDLPKAKQLAPDISACIREWYRQQMWLACDERVTILGHPWYIGKGLWYEDFSVIPRGMNLDIAAALKENRKYVECNSHFFRDPKTTEKFRHQYAEFLRELFEMGIPVTYGSDAHNDYSVRPDYVEEYLSAAGFREGDIVEISESDLW
ncbi:MAG: PHP domain-containing protein [Ruminococcaceae bacterium]|nr:PHP domain-containing protein [Oscillospiraceae bacterium]